MQSGVKLSPRGDLGDSPSFITEKCLPIIVHIVSVAVSCMWQVVENC